MNTFFIADIIAGKRSAGSTALACFAACLAVLFWVATTGNVDASSHLCTVCHKQRQNVEVPCNNSAYRRHLAHGDSAGTCPASQNLKPLGLKTVIIQPVFRAHD